MFKINNSALSGISVLLADDVELNQLIIKHIVELAGGEINCVNSGEDVISALADKTYQFDIVLMDLHMPGMNGIDATQKIRRESPNSHIPIIALTASITDESRKICYQMGFNEFLPKPFESEKLVELILTHCYSKSKVEPKC